MDLLSNIDTLYRSVWPVIHAVPDLVQQQYGADRRAMAMTGE
jgi:hypothetical protein